ncbi:MAG: GspE/PulE/PilB domain-containing protein [Planctomycetota bacterium]|jgi:hypothetical protein
MRFYERLRRKRLSDILIDEGVATKEAVLSAFEEHQQSKRLLSEVLMEGNELSEFDLAKVLVAQYQLPFVDLSSYNFHKDLFKKYPAELLHRAGVVPLDLFGETVCFACQEFPSEEVATELESHGSGKIFYFVALAMEIKQALVSQAPISETNMSTALGSEPGPGAPAAEAEAPAGGAWKELFDMANESILAGLDGEDAEAAAAALELVDDPGDSSAGKPGRGAGGEDSGLELDEALPDPASAEPESSEPGADVAYAFDLPDEDSDGEEKPDA